MKKSVAVLVGFLALGAPGCGSEEVSNSAESAPRSTATAPPTSSFADTRAAILAAVDKGDYAALRPLIDADVFLSDFGFGEEPDPAGRWEKMGSQPLETMGVLLRMRHVARKTNEGTLYQWPAYDPDSDPGDLTARERRALRHSDVESGLGAADHGRVRLHQPETRDPRRRHLVVLSARKWALTG